MVATAKITSKGQVTLPREVRRLLNVEAGSVIIFEKKDNRVYIRPGRTLLEFRGYLKGKSRTGDFDTMRETAKAYIGGKRIHGKR